jgi:hypothetical protein
VIWRVLLTVLYAGVLGGLMALENSNPGMFDIPLLTAWLAAPLVGFLVGRWWVLLAVAGELIGRAIGWDPGGNDGNPAFWPPYVVTATVLLGLPLLLGVVVSKIWHSHQQAVQPGGGGDPQKNDATDGPSPQM